MNAGKEANPKQSLATHPSARWARGLGTSDVPDSDKALAIFQPDILVHEQFLSTYVRRFHLEPEKILMLAVLRDGVACFQENLGATEQRKRQRFLDANRWIMNEDRSYFLSFENICDALGFEPSYMRQGLMKWKEDLLAVRGARRFAS
jgi:hypothetical protein